MKIAFLDIGIYIFSLFFLCKIRCQVCQFSFFLDCVGCICISRKNIRQGLFLKAIVLRRICVAVCMIALLFMVFSKADLRTLLPSSLCMGTGLFFASIAALAAIISTNFTKYFILFHHMFFNNDLWILDPSTDMLINIVPEGFFMDTAGRIAFLFGSLSLILFGLCLIMTLKNKRRK